MSDLSQSIYIRGGINFLIQGRLCLLDLYSQPAYYYISEETRYAK